MSGSKAKELTGQVFGRLTVVTRAGSADRKALWLCRCVCGNEVVVLGCNLRSGNSASCGCLEDEVRRANSRALVARNTTHGHNRKGEMTPTYMSWSAMRRRCLNPKHIHFANYGGRGITICERWSDFANFLEDMGPRPDGRSLDRINNEGNYEPANCRWATPYEQIHNRRKNATYCGKPLREVPFNG